MKGLGAGFGRRRGRSTSGAWRGGYTDDAVFQRGVLPEGTAFIQKPFTTGGPARKVREILDS